MRIKIRAKPNQIFAFETQGTYRLARVVHVKRDGQITKYATDTGRMVVGDPGHVWILPVAGDWDVWTKIRRAFSSLDRVQEWVRSWNENLFKEELARRSRALGAPVYE
jgi:hypothetical protein